MRAMLAQADTKIQLCWGYRDILSKENKPKTKIKNKEEGPERWFKRLKALTAIPEDLGSIPGTYVAAQRCTKLEFQGM